MSTNIDVSLIFKAIDRVGQTVKSIDGQLKNMGRTVDSVTKSTGSMEKSTSMLSQTMSMAAGMMIRDFVTGLAGTLREVTELGGKLQTLSVSFSKLTAASKTEVSTLAELRVATRGTVSDVDLLTAANQAMLLGLPTENLAEMMGAAMTLGDAMGIDAAFAVESLTKGVGRQSKMILDNLGIVFEATDAYTWYAEKIGATDTAIDGQMQSLEATNDALERAQSQYQALESSLSDLETQYLVTTDAIDGMSDEIDDLNIDQAKLRLEQKLVKKAFDEGNIEAEDYAERTAHLAERLRDLGIEEDTLRIKIMEHKEVAEDQLVVVNEQKDALEKQSVVVNEAEKAYEQLTKGISVSGPVLDEAQKKQAWMEYAIKLVTEQAEELGTVISETSLKQQQFAASAENAKASMGGLLGPLAGVMPILNAMAPMMSTIAMVVLPQLIAKYGLTGMATGVLSGAQGVLNAVMSANPIMLVVLALAALVGAILWAYHNVEWFRDAVDATFKFLSNVFGPILQTIGGILTAAIGSTFEAVGATVQWFHDLTLGFINWFLGFFGVEIEDLGEIIGLIGIAFDVIGKAVGHVWHTYLEPFGKWLQDTFGWILDGISGSIDAITGAIKPLQDAIGGLSGVGESVGQAWGATGEWVGSWLPGGQRGGITRGPTRMLIGEAGTEALIPLDRASEFGFGGNSVVIQGPLLVVEGSVDEATALRAVELMYGELESVIVEATSKGSSVKTDRIRKARLLS